MCTIISKPKSKQENYNECKLQKTLENPNRPRHEQRRPHPSGKITSNIVAKMGKGEDVSMESLRKICIALDCEIGDIMEVNAGAGEKQ